jgi:PAS domain S-box-containing protein
MDMSGPHGDLPEGYCHFDLENESYRIGVIGTGPGFRAILDIIFSEEYRDFLPPLTLVGLAEPGPEREKLASPRLRGVPVYDSLPELLGRHPDINLLIELVGKRFKVRQIVDSLPQGVSFIDHTASFFLSALNNVAKAQAHCRLDLDRQRVLLRAVFDEVNEDILLLDTKGRIVDVSRNVAERRGLKKDECLGQPCTAVQTIQDKMPFCPAGRDDCPFFVCLRTRERAEAMETRVGPDGRLLYYRVYAYPIFNLADELTHVLVMRRDITARTMCEKVEQQAQRLDIVAKMSTYLAHEIRNPLFAIAGFANSMLKSRELGDKDWQKAQIIVEESQRLDTILKNLLDFSRPAAQAAGACDVGQVVRETVSRTLPDLCAPGLDVETELAEGLPRVACDGELLGQCLVNLIKNAVEAMPNGGRLTVRAAMHGPNVALSVEDTGIGMSEETLDQIFNPFFSTKRGYGMGLPLVKKIIEDCGGSVDAASKPGQGSKVTLSIPPVPAAGQA